MTSSKPVLAISAIGPIILLTIVIAFLLGPASTFLQFGIVLPEVTIEKVEFVENEIQATVRNTGPIALIASTGLDEVIILYFCIKIINIFFYKKTANPTFFRKFSVMCMEHVQSRIFVAKF